MTLKLTSERLRQIKKAADRGKDLEIPVANDLHDCLVEIAALEECITQLHDALATYGGHLEECNCVNAPSKPCSCGLTAALGIG